MWTHDGKSKNGKPKIKKRTHIFLSGDQKIHMEKGRKTQRLLKKEITKPGELRDRIQQSRQTSTVIVVGSPSEPEKIQVLSVCKTCGKWSKFFRCSLCHIIFYCSKECQKADWARHKPLCAITNEGGKYAGDTLAEGVKLVKSMVYEQANEMADDQGSVLEMGVPYFLNVSIETLIGNPTLRPRRMGKTQRAGFPPLPQDSKDYFNIVVALGATHLKTPDGGYIRERYLLRFEPMCSVVQMLSQISPNKDANVGKERSSYCA
jgi:hypothetical protein